MRKLLLITALTLAAAVGMPEFQEAIRDLIALLPSDIQPWLQAGATVATVLLIAWTRVSNDSVKK